MSLTTKAAILLAAASTGVDDLASKLRSGKGIVVVLVTTFLAGVPVGAFAVDLFSRGERLAEVEAVVGVDEKTNLRERVQRVERWQEFHVDSVTGPRVRQIASLQAAQDTLRRRLAGIERVVRCMYYEIAPDRCPGENPEPPR